MKIPEKFLIALYVLGTGLSFNLGDGLVQKADAQALIVSYDQCMDPNGPYNGRINFCHATSSEENPYNFLFNMPCQSTYGRNENAGHFSENGTSLSGHENDYFTDDETCGETITPSPTPTVSPSPSVNPNPSITPTPETNTESTLSTVNLDCYSDDVHATHHIVKDGQDQSGVRVVSKYNGVELITYTDNDGKASVKFAYTGDGYVDSKPDGYSSAANFVTKETDCGTEKNEEETTTTSVGGQVLGATTDPELYAEAGVTTDILMAIMGISGVGLTTTGIMLNGRKNS